MILLEKHLVPLLEKPIRLQEYGIGIFATKPTRSGFKKAIKKELVYVNGSVASTAIFIKGNELIELYKEENRNVKEFIFPLNVIFEDDHLAVIHKPAGILVNGNSFATIQNALAKNVQKSSQKDAVAPRTVHRLDYPTSGLLLTGKTSSAIIALSKLFEYKRIQKTYLAVTLGTMNSEGIINSPIDEKEALTTYTVIASVTSERFGFLNLVRLKPKTGRKHQLRKHLFEIGTPILGDKDYFLEDLISYGNGLYLHAYKLDFIHPVTQKQLTITSAIPKKISRIFPNVQVDAS